MSVSASRRGCRIHCRVDKRSTRAASAARAYRPRRVRAFVASFVLVALVLAALVLWRTQERFVERPAPEIGFGLVDGTRLALSGLRGKVVLVDFWATSCTICIAEMPAIARLHRELQARGLVTVAVAMPYDRPDHVLRYARSNALPFPVALDPMGEATRALGPIRGTPTLVLIDRAGTIVRVFEGSVDFAGLRAAIERALGA